MRRLPLAIAVLGTFCAPAWADFRAEFESVKDNGEIPPLSRIELSGSHMRTDAGKVSMLFDTQTGKMIVLMNDKRTYMDMEKVAQTVGAAMSTANAALASLPPEQRAMVERQLGNHGASVTPRAAVHMTPTAVSERVAGFGCQVYRSEVQGGFQQSTCLANAGDAGISPGDQATLRSAFEQMKAMGERMSGGIVRSPMADIPTDKFPVKITHLDDTGKAVQISQLKNVTTTPVDAGDFKIPAGYTEQSMADMGRSH
jgi:Domain of unknown function (DUF4412)